MAKLPQNSVNFIMTLKCRIYFLFLFPHYTAAAFTAVLSFACKAYKNAHNCQFIITVVSPFWLNKIYSIWPSLLKYI
jgi:hypothetical protein